jgi:hypothetical protein
VLPEHSHDDDCPTDNDQIDRARTKQEANVVESIDDIIKSATLPSAHKHHTAQMQDAAEERMKALSLVSTRKGENDKKVNTKPSRKMNLMAKPQLLESVCQSRSNKVCTHPFMGSFFVNPEIPPAIIPICVKGSGKFGKILVRFGQRTN